MTKPTASAIRASMKTRMTQTVNDNTNWTYRAVRPLSVPLTWKKGQHVVSDCSKGAQYLACWAGAPDPMRNDYGPYGNSTTIWLNLPHISLAQAQTGDPVVFGPDKHVTVIYEVGKTPATTKCWNMGTQGQPVFRTLQYEIDGHRRIPWQVCQLMPTPRPTPADKLQKETGFYAWVAWRLGEGHWRKYGSSNPKVRPAVPRLIPPRWWRDYLSFLRARDKGNESV